MEDIKDYEGIGRYHTAINRVQSLKEQRRTLASSMIDLMYILTSLKGYIAHFDHNDFQTKLDKLSKVHIELEIAIMEADRYAPAAGKRPINRA